MIDPLTGLPLWRAARAERDPVSERIAEALKERQAAERWRLLYVAMTRARDRLHVAGWAKKRGGPEGSWHDVIARGLRSRPDVEDSGDGGLRLTRGIAGSEERVVPAPPPAPAPPPGGRRPPRRSRGRRS
jgi:ATP-dependent helicase/nuclease subunit A